MAEAPVGVDEQIRVLLQVMAGEGIRKAAEGFSGMLGEELSVSHSQVVLIPLVEIPMLLGGPEAESVGIYLQVHGELGGQMMLVLPYQKAMELTDLMIGAPVGTTTHLGSLERSALAEAGNITGTFFLNTVASLTGLGARPSPPAVMVDMVGAIIDIIIAVSGSVSDHVLMISSSFLRGGREVEASFWVIPDVATLEAFVKHEAEYDRG